MKRRKSKELKKPVFNAKKCSCASGIWLTGICDYCREYDALVDAYTEELDAKANGGCDW